MLGENLLWLLRRALLELQLSLWLLLLLLLLLDLNWRLVLNVVEIHKRLLLLLSLGLVGQTCWSGTLPGCRGGLT